MFKKLLITAFILVSICSIVFLAVNMSGTADKKADQFKISIPSQSHTDYGLTYPVTYMFNVSSVDITVWHKHNPDADWKALAEETTGNCFNGIEAVRFDEGMAYVSIAFDAGSDNIYLSFTDRNGDPVKGVTYKGISEYYDNRNAVVTMTNDDFGSLSNLASFQAMWEAIGSRNIWATIAVITTPTTGNNKWGKLQAAVDGGYIEVASHTQTHGYPPQGDEIEASMQDIIDNLVLSPAYNSGVSEYIPLFIAPYLALTSDDLTQCGTSKYLAIISSDLGTKEPGWGTWNDTEGVYNPKYVSPNYEEMTEAELNARFNERYAAGDIYHLRGHPYNESTWASGKMANHLDYIKGKSDIWYVGYGAMYMYHYVQERGLINVSESNIASPESPMVIGVSPGSGNTEDSALVITVTGAGFENGSGLALELNNNGADSIRAKNLNWVSSNQIDAIFDLTGVASNLGGTWDITVTNPDGQTGRGNDLFTIYRPDPIISFITPDGGVNNDTVHVTLSGSNFVSGQTSVKLTRIRENDISATGIVTNGTTELTADFDLTGQAGGICNVMVTVEGAQSQAILVNAFNIKSLAPTVTDISPGSGTIKESALIVSVIGTGFINDIGLALELNNNGGDSIAATSITWVNSTQIDATFDLTGVTSNLGKTWDIQVTNPDGQTGTGDDLFTIYRPAPIITSITPDNGVNNGTVHVTITGSNFANGQTSVKLTRPGEKDITGTNIVINGTTKITADFDLTGVISNLGGTWDIQVTNPDGQTGKGDDLFTVYRPAPMITSITPDSGVNKGIVHVTITGSNFVNGQTSVKLTRRGEKDISGTNIVINGTTEIKADFDLSGQDTGRWDVIVFVEGAQSTDRLANGFTILRRFHLF